MPKGQKPYRAQSKRPILPKAGLTTFGKDRAETTASISVGAQRGPAPKTEAGGMKGEVMGYNKHKPVTERIDYLDEEITKRSK